MSRNDLPTSPGCSTCSEQGAGDQSRPRGDSVDEVSGARDGCVTTSEASSCSGPRALERMIEVTRRHQGPERTGGATSAPCPTRPPCRQGQPLAHRPVTELRHLDHLLEGAFPSFGGGYMRRVWDLLDRAIGEGVPMTLAVAGPVTASGQHIAWLNPLLETGWFCLLSTTDAVCYHDGHRSLDDAAKHPIHEVPIFGDDGALRDDRIIRITDVGFDEDVLLGQDSPRRVLARPEFQRSMSGTSPQPARPRLRGQEARTAPRGLLALCHQGIPSSSARPRTAPSS